MYHWDPGVFSRFLFNRFNGIRLIFRCVFNAVRADKESVRVDAVRSTGDEGAQIPSLEDFQAFHLIGQYDLDLVDFIAQRLADDLKHEAVSDLHFFQIGKQARRGKTGMAGQNSMGIFAAYGKGAPFQVAYALLEHRIGGPVINGQMRLDFGYVDIAHHAVIRDAKDFVIVFQRILRELLAELSAVKIPVELDRILPQPLRALIVHGSQVLRVFDNGVGLMEHVVIIARGGIQQDPDADGKDQERQQTDAFFLFLLHVQSLSVNDEAFAASRSVRYPALTSGGLGRRAAARRPPSVYGQGARMDLKLPFIVKTREIRAICFPLIPLHHQNRKL